MCRASGRGSKCQIRTKEEENDDLLSADPASEQVHDQSPEVLVLDRLKIHFSSLLLNGISFFALFELFSDSFEITSKSRQIRMRVSIYGHRDGSLIAGTFHVENKKKNNAISPGSGSGEMSHYSLHQLIDVRLELFWDGIFQNLQWRRFGQVLAAELRE